MYYNLDMQYLKNGKDSPIKNHYDYIQLIALMNCCDFFIELGLIGKNKTPILKNPREAFRKYINAIISLDHIFDYLYYHSKYKNRISFKNYKNNILSRFPVLKKISNYANAFKHCERTGTILETEENEDTELNFGLPFNLHLIKEASKIWHKYINGNIQIDFQE